MENKILNDTVDKICSIYLQSFCGNSYTGKIVEIDNHWLKLQIKNDITIINLNSITSIEILSEKYND